jgi:hypothetical protein
LVSSSNYLCGRRYRRAGSLSSAVREIANCIAGNRSEWYLSYDPVSGCDSATVNFQALINAFPQPTDWYWDFGNGNASTEQTPLPQDYTSPGTYIVSLTTNVYNYALTVYHSTPVMINWCGDVEEPYILVVQGDPDPFFYISDAMEILFTRRLCDNTQSYSWTVNNVILLNPPYSITFEDYDPISQNDLLGTFLL